MLMVTMLTLVSVSVSLVRATGSTVQSCAVTPDLLGGQGFSVSGQGFSVSGQGFSVSGQGFSVSGQGFSVSGQGLDPLVVAAEIRDNPITPGKWIQDRLNLFLGKAGFNAEPTAILIIDEFQNPDSHGFLVQRVVNDSLAALRTQVPNLKIDSFQVDISDSTANYNADLIANKIDAKINQLKNSAQKYRNFILNMSFGLIECESDGPTINGVDLPAFSFNQAAQTIEAQNAATPTRPVHPTLECVTSDGHGKYTAYFGYRNENDQSVVIPIGHKNKFWPTPENREQPTFFEPGHQRYVFKVQFNGQPLTWKLKGPDGQERTVTASSSPSQRCASKPPAPTQPVTPILECVANMGNGVYKARFGYNNPNSVGITIPVGLYNKFTPHPLDRGQVTTFAPGKHEKVFEVTFNGSSLVWKVKHISTTAATSSSPACAAQTEFGMGQYFTQSLGVPQDLVDDYWNHLTQQVNNDPSQVLRGLLQDYLAASADPAANLTVVPVASSGNLRPWLGDAPLAPASWVETIAVGATLNDSDRKWPFSQRANVVAPGAGYVFSPTNYGAGTSFSAPAFSVLTALCATIPDALQFDGTHPPLVTPVINRQKNLLDAPISTTSLAPLACNTAPAATEVAIDIKPLSPFNRINLSSHGIVRMAILSSATFDAHTVNPQTVTLAGAPALIRRHEFLTRIWDINRDGRKDLVLPFRIQDMQLTAESTQAEMEGTTYSGTPIHGVDSVKVVSWHTLRLLLPLNNTTARGRVTTLFWEALDMEEEDNTCFQVEIDNNSNFSSPEQRGITVGQTRYTTTTGLREGRYYWRIAVSDCASTIIGNWSETWSFQLKP